MTADERALTAQDYVVEIVPIVVEGELGNALAGALLEQHLAIAIISSVFDRS